MLVGHSLAAFHAEAFARLYPARTAAVLLVDGSVEPRARARPLPGARVATALGLAGAARLLALPYLLGPPGRRLVVRLATARGRDPAPRALVRRCYRSARALRAALLENTCYLDQAAELLSLRRELPLTAPVALLVAGSAFGRPAARDGRPGPGARRRLDRQARLAAELGGALHTVAPAGHLLMLDQPAAVAEAVLKF